MPKYLRVALTEKCPMKCTFCHNEGAGTPDKSSTLSLQYWYKHISDAVENGIRKVKFVGGEPLLYKELPLLIGRLRKRYPILDLSIITSGALPVEKLQRCFDMGLSRANLSIHGWGLEYFQRNSNSKIHYVNRQKTLEYLLSLGRPLKLNYVYSSFDIEEDLIEFLMAMKNKKVVINVLDDLSNAMITPQFLVKRLTHLMGEPLKHRDIDENSLSTIHLKWGGPMFVEIKDQHLGELSPWKSCDTCPIKERCTEGIHAIRMYADGTLGLCMDREDLRWNIKFKRDAEYTAMNFVRSHLAIESIR